MSVAGQPITFIKNYGWMSDEYGLAIDKTIDGGYIIAGYVFYGNYPGLSKRDGYVVKIDSLGNTLWTKTFCIPGMDNNCNINGNSVLQTTDGNYLIAGSAQNIPSTIYGFAILLNSSGDTLWTRLYTTDTITRNFEINDVAEYHDSILIMVGTSFIYPVRDIKVIKTNLSGDTISTRIIGSPYFFEEGNAIDISNDGRIIIGGSIADAVGYGTNYNAYIARINANLDTLWTRSFGGSYYDQGYDVKCAGNDGFVLAGVTYSFDNFYYPGVYLIKTDDAGNLDWSDYYYSVEFNGYGYGLDVTTDSGFIITGSTYNSLTGDDGIFLLRIDRDGNQLWRKIFPSAEIYANNWDQGNDVLQTKDGGFIAAGQKYLSALTRHDAYIIKTDSLGNVFKIPPDTNDTNLNVLLPKTDIMELTVYPNPATHQFDLEFTMDYSGFLNIYLSSITGEFQQKIFSGFISGPAAFSKRIRTENLSPGVYLLFLYSSAGKTIKRFIVYDP